MHVSCVYMMLHLFCVEDANVNTPVESSMEGDVTE